MPSAGFGPLRIFRKGIDRRRRTLRCFPAKKAARNRRSKVHSIAKNALGLRRRLGNREFLEGILVAGKVRFSGRKFIEAENIREKIGSLGAGKRAGSGGG